MERNRLVFSVFALLLPLLSMTQEFRWSARLDPVTHPGFYEVPLHPALTAKLKSDLSDLRIIDSAGANVAYLVRNVASYDRTLAQIPILLIEKDSSESRVEISLDDVGGTDHLFLLMGNTAVARPATISGSDDRKRWFIVADNLLLAPSAESRTDRLLQSVQFPFNRYRFLKILIRDGASDPMNILGAAVHSGGGSVRKALYADNTGTSFVQREKGRKSMVHIQHRDAYITDRLLLGINGPRFYKRTARLLITSEGARQADVIRSFELRSGDPHEAELPSVKVQSMVVEIDNGDDPPLQVEWVKTQQEQRSVVAYLQPGTGLTLLAGNKDVAAPRFDLAGFTDSIPGVLPILQHAAPLVHTQPQKGQSNKNWLWAAIIVMVSALGFFTFRLTKDMHREGPGKGV